MDIDFQLATTNSDARFLERILVNYIRHQLTIYESELEEIYGKVGNDDGYKLLNNKIYDKISEVYPSLKNECNRQLSLKFERQE
jgi:hypothetical protein